MIFFHTSWLVRLQSGPIWPNFANTERSVCRKNWWANILYINNIFTSDEPVKYHRFSHYNLIVEEQSNYIWLFTYWVLVYTTRLVFGGRFSISHCWHADSNDFVAIPQIHENNFRNMCDVIDRNTVGGDLCEQIRWNFSGNARVSDTMTVFDFSARSFQNCFHGLWTLWLIIDFVWQKSTIRSLVWCYVSHNLHSVICEFRQFSVRHDRWLFVLLTQARSHWFGANESKLDFCWTQRTQLYRALFQFLAILWWAMIPIAFSALLSGFIFYAHEYEKPSYWIAIYSAFGKNVWGLFGATVITGIAVNTGCEC